MEIMQGIKQWNYAKNKIIKLLSKDNKSPFIIIHLNGITLNKGKFSGVSLLSIQTLYRHVEGDVNNIFCKLQFLHLLLHYKKKWYNLPVRSVIVILNFCFFHPMIRITSISTIVLVYCTV